ncbi:MAG: hypothetical protein NZM35_09835 [Chitinophagales bacterium]|nr:hypothetical protein [Chitinophagales bacterium]MDW8419580.1 hypothetical protein [Chitinophagales bacterium]
MSRNFIICFLLWQAYCAAQSENIPPLPIDSINRKIVYQKVITFPGGLSQEQIFDLAIDWFNTNQDKCVRRNAISESLVTNLKNYREVQKVFQNTRPLQSLDPASYRMAVRIINRYIGNQDGMVKVVYLDYYLVISVSNNQMTATISDIVYNHFNPRNYNPQRIGDWLDQNTYDAISRIENLINACASYSEITQLFTYLHQDTHLFLDQLEYQLLTNAVALKKETIQTNTR